MPEARKLARQLAEEHAEIRAELTRALRRRGAAQEDAEDIVSASLATILSLPSDRVAKIDNLRAYMHAVARNLHTQRVREASRQVIVDHDELDYGIDEHGFSGLEDAQTQSLVVRAFGHLGQRPQEILWHSVVEGEPVAEIADRLGITVNNVTTQTFRAKAALREAYISEFIAQAPPQCGYDPGHLARIVSGSAPRRMQEKYIIHASGCVFCPGVVEAARAEATWAPSSLAMIALGGISTGMLTLRTGAASASAAALHAPALLQSGAATLVGAALVCGSLATAGPVLFPQTGNEGNASSGSTQESFVLEKEPDVSVTPEQVALPMPAAGDCEGWVAFAGNEADAPSSLLATAQVTEATSTSEPATLSVSVRRGDTHATLQPGQDGRREYIFLGQLGPGATTQLHADVCRDGQDTDQTAAATIAVEFLAVTELPAGTRPGDLLAAAPRGEAEDALAHTGSARPAILFGGALLGVSGLAVLGARRRA